MKILHINTFDTGGAAQSCIRLHQGLLKCGVHSGLLLKQKTKNVQEAFQFMPSVNNRLEAKVRRILFEFRMRKDPVKSKKQLSETAFIQQLPAGSEYFSFPTTGINIMESPLYQEADIIHLHWIADFVDYPSFFKYNKKPMVWTLHDMGPFQGGLHYEEKYIGVDHEGKPLERKFQSNEISMLEDNVRIKMEAFMNVSNLHVVCPSQWLMQQSQKSELLSRFPHCVIPYGVNEEIFKVKDKTFARDVLGLPLDKKIVLFVADSIKNNRKGFSFLYRALDQIHNDDFFLCAVGSADTSSHQPNVNYLGRLGDERLMSLVYSAADVFVIPSLEDNLPNTVLESLLSGTPVVGFPVGGIQEVIVNRFNGYVCSDISVSALSDSINKTLRHLHEFNREKICQQAQKDFNLERQALNYMELYAKIVQ